MTTGSDCTAGGCETMTRTGGLVRTVTTEVARASASVEAPTEEVRAVKVYRPSSITLVMIDGPVLCVQAAEAVLLVDSCIWDSKMRPVVGSSAGGEAGPAPCG